MLKRPLAEPIADVLVALQKKYVSQSMRMKSGYESVGLSFHT